MTAKEKDRKWPGLKNHHVHVDIDGSRHIVCTLLYRPTYTAQPVPFLIDGKTELPKLAVIEQFLLRTELPNGDVIEY